METCHRAIANSKTTTSWMLLLDQCHNKKMGFQLKHVSAVTPDRCRWCTAQNTLIHLQIIDCWAHLRLLGDQIAGFTPGLSVPLPVSSEPLDVSTEVVSNLIRMRQEGNGLQPPIFALALVPPRYCR